jgi:hypothetical protein
MNPEWDKFQSALSTTMIKAHKINVDDNENRAMADEFGAKAVPHIVKVKTNIRYVYHGERTKEELLKWVKS